MVTQIQAYSTGSQAGTWAGVGSVVTVSTQGHADRYERMARRRVARDGVAALAAETSNGRQRRLLGRVRDGLASDAGLDVFYGDRRDGMSYLTVYLAGERSAGIWGEPNGTANPESYFPAE